MWKHLWLLTVLGSIQLLHLGSFLGLGFLELTFMFLVDLLGDIYLFLELLATRTDSFVSLTILQILEDMLNIKLAVSHSRSSFLLN